MRPVDLHVHSDKSDGSLSPTALVDYAIEKGLRAFALTDHDTTEGLAEAITYAADKDIEVIPGIEFSTEYLGKDIHIVGLYIDYNNESFNRKLVEFRDSRINRNIKMCDNLREAGIDISYERLCNEFDGSVITRAHYAKYLLKYGYVSSLSEAFEKYIGDTCKYFVPREKVSPEAACALILEAGGIPVLAHPILYHMSEDELSVLITRLIPAGLVGIEALYSTYNSEDEALIRKLAAKHNLRLSGGSDFHGNAKPGLDLATGYGELFVPEDILDKLKA